MMTVKAILILDGEGNRVVGKYYNQYKEDPWPAKQDDFEKLLKKKAQPASQVLMLSDCVAVFREFGDVTLFVVGDKNENELILDSVITCFYESLSGTLRNEAPSKISILDYLDHVLLILDEMIDGGIILEGESQHILERVAVRNQGESGGAETITAVLKSATDILMS